MQADAAHRFLIEMKVARAQEVAGRRGPHRAG